MGGVSRVAPFLSLDINNSQSEDRVFTIKMAENCVKISRKLGNRKMTGKRRFLRFDQSVAVFDSGLDDVITRVRIGNRFWREICDESEDDSRETNDFEGFGKETEKGEESREQESRDTPSDHSLSERIQKLLQFKWRERVRLLETKKETKETTLAVTSGQQKTILRKARLQINKRTLQRIRSEPLMQSSKQIDISFNTIISDNKSNNNTGNNDPHARPVQTTCRSGQPGYITCCICGATKFYSHVQRRYGVFSCEPCSKFFARFIKEPKQFFCQNSGDCPLSQKTRCRACWLKVCLQKFAIDAHTRQTVATRHAPKLATQPQCALITVDTSAGSGQSGQQQTQQTPPAPAQPLLMVAKRKSSGPRVKRVCRSAGVVSGLPRATFDESSDSDVCDALPVCFEKSRVQSRARQRCRECSGCLVADCGQCTNCRDKKKFGGQNVIRQACRRRRCLNRGPHSPSMT